MASVCVVAVAASLAGVAVGRAPDTTPTRTAPAAAEGPRLAEIPLGFEPNVGQAGEKVHFLARAPSYDVALTGDGALFTYTDGDRLPLSFVDGRRPTAITAGKRLPGETNYLIGADPSSWHRGIPTYEQVTYESVYDGIDAVFHGAQGGALEYDFVVAPGADPADIGLSFGSEASREITPEGDLRLRLDRGVAVQPRPHVYQETSTGTVEVPGGFEEKANGSVGFWVGGYDPSVDLVIDPVMSYSTYIGGGGEDRGLGIAVDSSGSAYLTGKTTSAQFPTTSEAFDGIKAAAHDIFVTKFTPDGSDLVYSTFIGGAGDDAAYAIAVDALGAAYVTGKTSSSIDYPTVGAFQDVYGGAGQDALVTKLSPGGDSLEYSTFLGGTSAELGRGITVDALGSAYVTGFTASADFPTSNPAQATYGGDRDVFITKMTPDGSLLSYSTFLGGRKEDQGRDVAVDADGALYLAGWARLGYPTLNAFQPDFGGANSDAIFAKLDAAGGLLTSSYLGKSQGDAARAVEVDATGFYIAGRTSSRDFYRSNRPRYAGGLNDVFVTKFELDASDYIYSVLIGGNLDDQARGLGIDSLGNAVVAGHTDSRDFQVVGFDSSYGGDDADAFVTKVNPTGTGLIYSRYLGGWGGEGAFAVAVDPGGSAYVGGWTQGRTYPTTEGAFQVEISARPDAFVTKVSD